MEEINRDHIRWMIEEHLYQLMNGACRDLCIEVFHDNINFAVFYIRSRCKDIYLIIDHLESVDSVLLTVRRNTDRFQLSSAKVSGS